MIVFLGGIKFAIILIALTATFVAAGTFLEAATDSHLFSAAFTYNNPLFLALIWGFFINILVSALRRWPFKIKHIPFLITHLGLLMLLGGVIVKSYLGTQGSMGLLEGASNHKIFLPNTYSIHLEKKDPYNPLKKISIDFPFKNVTKQNTKFDGVEMRIVDYAEHSSERLQTWIKDQDVTLLGTKKIPVYTSLNQNLSYTKTRFHHDEAKEWNLIALQTEDFSEASKKTYLQGTVLEFKDRIDNSLLAEVPLEEALNNLTIVKNLPVKCKLLWDCHALNGLENACLEVFYGQDKMCVPLMGQDSLLNQTETSLYLGKLPIAVNIKKDPTILFLQDRFKDDHILAFNCHGEIKTALYNHANLQSLMIYDEGFGGYAAFAKIPFGDFACGREEKEAAELAQTSDSLQAHEEHIEEFSPPLQLIKKAADQARLPFGKAVVDILNDWENQRHILWSPSTPELQSIANQLNWNVVSLDEQYACGWLCQLLDEMEPQLQNGKTFTELLKERNWPFISYFNDLDTADTEKAITLFSQQLFSAARQLPPPQIMPVNIPNKALSAYLWAYGITLNNIRQPQESAELVSAYHAKSLNSLTKDERLLLEKSLKNPEIHIESPVTLKQTKLPSLKRWEDNHPLVTLEFRKNNQKEYFTLTYDKFGTGLAWPILDGEYLIRFQPIFKEIPYKIHLHDARQINYPNSGQAFSYEADIIVTDMRDQSKEERTISMNQVYETKDGYRFYLSSLSPGDESAAQRVQIVVNHDPAKYWLTYSGAFILSLGILLLFWMRPYKK